MGRYSGSSNSRGGNVSRTLRGRLVRRASWLQDTNTKSAEGSLSAGAQGIRGTVLGRGHD